MDYQDDEEDTLAAWHDLIELGESRPGTALAALADELRKGGLPPQSGRNTSPVIIDTDICGDPDDAVALAVAARQLPELALVITSDERGGERARFARHFLNCLGRPDVPVIAGADLGNNGYFYTEGLCPDNIPAQSTNLINAVKSVCAQNSAEIRWIGIGPLTNLAAVLKACPELVNQFVVTQMGGAFNYRKPDQAEHNIRVDVEAARYVLNVVREPGLVISDVTFTDDLEISARSPIYQRLAQSDAPQWAQLIKTHMDNWFSSVYRSTIQHDALTLSAALEFPFVNSSFECIQLDEIGRMEREPTGPKAYVSYSARYAAFMRWLERQLFE